MKKLFVSSICVLFTQLSNGESHQQMQRTFTKIYENNWWGDKESASGTGSNLRQTQAIRMNLPSLLKLLKVETLLDAPCGDFHWMKEVDLSFLKMYIGADIVESLTKRNQQSFSNSNRMFKCLNIVYDPLPKADLILCRDCLVHLEFNDCMKAIRNFKRSGAKYLLISTFTNNRPNKELDQNGWRTLNMQLPPFNFPEPVMMLNEDCSEGDGAFHDKSLGLWLLEDISL